MLYIRNLNYLLCEHETKRGNVCQSCLRKIIYRAILIRNKVHNILIGKYVKRYIPYPLLFHRKYTRQKKEN